MWEYSHLVIVLNMYCMEGRQMLGADSDLRVSPFIAKDRGTLSLPSPEYTLSALLV